jgi:hypothetical protein
MNALDKYSLEDAKLVGDGRGAEQSEDEKLRVCRGLLSTLEQQYSDWKRISFLNRPMMRQEFAKLTEMSVEDMISTLSKLEESLKNQAPVTEFVEPLRKLARFNRNSGNGSPSSPVSGSNNHIRLTDPEILASMIVSDAEKGFLDQLNGILALRDGRHQAETRKPQSTHTPQR